MAVSNDQLDSRFYDGRTRNVENKVDFEEVGKPPQSAWNEWKSFLFRNFIKGDNKLQYPLQLNTGNGSREAARCDLESQIEKKNALRETIASFPAYLKEIMYNVQLPEDGGRQLLETINMNELIGASNGSIKECDKGGYAFSLQAYYTDEGRIIGGGKVPKSNSTTSLTAELYGMIGVLGSILAICTQYQHEIDNNSIITVTTDNNEVVKRLSNEITPMNVQETWALDYDLSQTMWDIRKLIPAQIKVEWVKGHQDKLENGQKIHGPFTRPAELNILMDRHANQERDDMSYEAPMRRTYQHTAIGLYDQHNNMITDFKKYSYNIKNGKKLREYIQRKYNWNNLEQEIIYWDSLEKAMKKQTEFKKSKLIQLMYNWQHDGVQKQNFQQQANVECPAKCGQVESHNHYLICEEKSMKESRLNKQRTLKQYLVMRETHPYIIRAIMLCLQQGVEKALAVMGEPSDEISKITQEAMEENMHLSENLLEKGFVSKKWKEAQRIWSRSIAGSKKRRQQQWGRDLVIGLQTYTYDVWKVRNEKLHGCNTAEANRIKKEKCIQRVKELYGMSRKHLSGKDKTLFCLPVQLRVKSSRSAMRRWIETVEYIFQTAVETEEK